ncbi:MAG: GuaB3 family IMP dehydrogenase-related protein [Acidimicrobiaceae bacterium]|nr:GuaB3 family IMP dehydrogenase-related protein [Acidimicrobiaceae bacterium]
MTEIEIGLGKSAKQSYRLDDIVVVPSRRTRDPDDIDTSWQIDAYLFDIPVLGAFADSITSPSTAIQMGELGGLGVLDLEGLWTRYKDLEPIMSKTAEMPAEEARKYLQKLYSQPVRPELVISRISEIAAAGIYAAGRVGPSRATELIPYAIEAEIDLIVIAGTVVSAEHISSSQESLNLKTFIRSLQIPVIVGGCTSYQAALHLMRTGAAGVLVGIGSDDASTNSQVLGIESHLATAIADARAARMRHLDETGVYCHIIADGAIGTAGDIAKAIACGADAVMLELPLASALDSPCPTRHWNFTASHKKLPRGHVLEVTAQSTLSEIINGPARSADGTTNLLGGLRTSMAKCGYTDIKDFQRANVAVLPTSSNFRDDQ